MRYVGPVLAALLVGGLAYHLIAPRADRGPPVHVAPADAGAPGAGEADPTGARPDRTGARGPAAARGGAAGAGAATDRREADARAAGAQPARAVAAVPRPSGLVVPVQGVAPGSLTPTFDDDRGEGRVHEALDIMAPTGTPVLAVADGHVEKLFDSDRGGLTIYQFEPSGHHAYYYAHLDRYATGLREGQALRQGEVIGYVGSTGNADPAAPHLHFAIFLLGPEKRWWEGTPVDPWPLLSGRTR